MASEPKTQPTAMSVEDFIARVEPEARREECRKLVAMMGKAARAPAVMWGSSIVGFGRYSYQYASGRSGDWPRVGFSPRKAALTLYLMDGYEDREEELAALGPHKTGKSCLYLKSLASVDGKVLEKMIRSSLKAMAKRYPEGA